MYNKWICLLPFLILVACGGSKESKPINVEIEVARKQTVIETVTSTGTIQPKNQVRLSADVSGKITDVYVKEGDFVEQGTLLVKLDQERYLASVENAQANVRASIANADLVRENMHQSNKELARTKEMVGKGLESQSSMDARTAAYHVEVARLRSSEEQVEQAKATLKQAQDDLERTLIYAPMSGTVSALRKEPGEIAIGSQFQEDIILIIADLTQMEAIIDIDEVDIVSITEGDAANVVVDALRGQSLQGKVTEIANSAKDVHTSSSDKIEYEITIAILQEDQRLRPGMTAKGVVTTDIQQNVVAVPLQSVSVRSMQQLRAMPEISETMLNSFHPDDADFVQLAFVVEGDRAVIKEVKTGIQGQSKIEIISGISPNQQVVVGNYRAISRELEHNTLVTTKANSAAE